METGQFFASLGDNPTVQRLKELGFSFAYHRYEKPESGASVSIEARHKGRGMRFQGFSKYADWDQAMKRLATSAAEVLSLPPTNATAG